MNKIFRISVIFLFLSVSLNSYSQILWGVSSTFGRNDNGLIFRYNVSTNSYLDAFEFHRTDGLEPEGITQGRDSVFYGVTIAGGLNNKGVIFSYNPLNHSFHVLVNLIDSIGSWPVGNLLLADNDKFYGMTKDGGLGHGVLFEYDYRAGIYTVLYKFKGSPDDGAGPFGSSLMQASDGKLYGTTQTGGKVNSGVIFEYDIENKAYSVLYSIDDTMNGDEFSGALCQALDGNLYGMTTYGGIDNRGVIYKYDMSLKSYQKIHTFTGMTDGLNPYGSLILAKDGFLYGLTDNWGSYGSGTLFRYGVNGTGGYVEMESFDISTGKPPRGTLLQASDGNLYGMTLEGGVYGKGTLFVENLHSYHLNTLVNFSGSTGNYPGGGANYYGSSLIEPALPAVQVIIKADTDNVCLGTAVTFKAEYIKGGDNPSFQWKVNGKDAGNNSYLFTYIPQNNDTVRCIMKSDYPGNVGEKAYSNYIIETVRSYPASIKIISNATHVCNGEKVTFTASSINSGTQPSYVWQVNGINVSKGSSTVYSYIPQNNDSIKCLVCSNMTCAQPNPAISNNIIISVNPIYASCNIEASSEHSCAGMSATMTAVNINGGINPHFRWLVNNKIFYHDSTVFTYMPSNNDTVKCIMTASDSCVKGSPYTSNKLILTVDTAGTHYLWGVTDSGGVHNTGVIFKYDIKKKIFSRMFDFNTPDTSVKGAYPRGSLLQANDGMLYGLTYNCPPPYPLYILGVLYRFDPVNNVYSHLIEFSTRNIYSGFQHPFGSLIQANNQKLYGITSGIHLNLEFIEVYDDGRIFEFNPSNNKIKDLYNFDTVNLGHYYPKGSLLQADNNKLYGLTTKGGNYNSGIIFEFDLSSGKLNKIHHFNGTEGAVPTGSLIQGKDGLLWGMADSGGVNNAGVLYTLDINTDLLKVMHYFNSLTGTNPNGSLIQAANGKFYGMTMYGGINSYGVLFEYDASANQYTDLFDFDVANGANPMGSLMQASDGKLYGLTRMGGNYKKGVLFEYDINSKTFSKLFDFDKTNGANPMFTALIEVKSKIPSITKAQILSDANNICQGKPATFHVSVTDETKPPIYEWKVNGYDSGNNSTIFTYIPSKNDNVSCILSNYCDNLPSNSILMKVIDNPNVSVKFDTIFKNVNDSLLITVIPSGDSIKSLQWFKNDTIISGSHFHISTSQHFQIYIDSLKLNDSGIYSSMISNVCDTIKAKICKLVVSPEVNVRNQNPVNNYFTIQPNPSKDYIIINLNPNLNLNKYLLKLRNIDGQEVLSEKINILTTCKINVSSLCSGVYILTLQNDKEYYVRKVVIQK